MLMFIHLHGVAGVGGICLGPMTLTPLDRASQGRGVQSQNVGCRNAVRCRIVPDAPEYGASAPSVIRRFSAGASNARWPSDFVSSWQCIARVPLKRRTELKFRTPGHLRCGNTVRFCQPTFGDCSPGQVNEVNEVPSWGCSPLSDGSTKWSRPARGF